MLTLMLLFLAVGPVYVAAQSTYYMDQPSGCGKSVRIGSAPVSIHGRSKVAIGNPPVTCVLYLQTDSVDTKYKLELTIESLTINDCSIKLEIFDHQQAFGQHLRSLGCGSKSTDTMYSSGQFITLKLSRSRDLYQPDYDYTLSVRAYSNEDELGSVSRVNRIGVEVIVPIIIALLLLIFVAVILCCCYRQGRLPGMRGRKPRKHMSGSSASLSNNGEKKQNGGLENPVVSVTLRNMNNDKNGFNHNNPIVWSTLTSADSSKDPITGRQRGRSALMSQSSGVPPPYSILPSSKAGYPGKNNSLSHTSNGYSPQNSSRMYHKNEPSGSSFRENDVSGRNVDSYLESKGVKIGIYPDDSLKRRHDGDALNRGGSRDSDQGKKRGSSGESQGKGRDSYYDDDVRKRGSYAEAQGRSRGSYADDDGRKRGSYAEAQGRERDSSGGHRSRREDYSVDENGTVRGRKGTSPSRRSSSPGGRGNSPSRKGMSSSSSPNRQGSSSPGRRRSPGEKRRSRSEDPGERGNEEAPPEGKLKRPSSGFFDNPDEEGYIYSYDHLYPGEDGDISGSTQPGESPKARHRKGRRGSEAVEFEEDEDGYLLVHNDSKSKSHGKSMAVPKQKGAKTSAILPQSDGTSYETIEMNPGQQSKKATQQTGVPKQKGERGTSKGNDPSQSAGKSRKIPELDDLNNESARYSSVDELSEPTERETMSNPLRSNPTIKSRVEGSKPLGDAESGPAKKRKGRNGKAPVDDTASEAGSVRYGIPPSARAGNQDPRERLDSYPYTVGPSAAFNTIAPRTTESMGQPEQSFISAFENRAPSAHNSPAHVAGKAAWYVHTTPSRKGPVTQGTFVMQTTSRQPSQEELEHRHPGYGEPPAGRFPDYIPSNAGSSHRPQHPASSSTPNSHHHRAPFNSHQHFSPIEKAERTPYGYGHGNYPQGRGYDRYPDRHAQHPHDPNIHPDNVANPRSAMVRSNPNTSQTPTRYAEPGTSIFDEPGHRAAVMRSGIDPHTGNEVNQVVWTDTIPDPTDPPGPNPSVTRKTITRITTRAGHGDIPEPDSMNSQLSFHTYAEKLSAPQDNDPAFLSPSTSHQRYGGNPRVPEPTPGQEYPGSDNVAFYLGLQGQSNPSARVHSAQARSQAIKDKISLPAESFA